MPVDDEAITAALLGEPELADLLAAGDVYLLRAQAHRRAGPPGEWDILVLLADDRDVPEMLTTPLGEDTVGALAVRAGRSPPGDGGGLGTLSVDLCGPAARRDREARDLSIWRFQLAGAQPLHAGWGGGEGYRAGVAARFAALRSDFARHEYVQFRAHRHEAAGALRHGDPMSVLLTGALAVRAAMRAWLLWAGRPYPDDSSLRAQLAEDPRGDDLLAAGRRVLHDQASPAERFDALQQMWWLLDRHARAHGAEAHLLAAWWALPELQLPVQGHQLPVQERRTAPEPGT
ncbi:MAG: hypothetical protein ACJ74O_11535 [Frankiaceae bacterium]